jgi:hypothetical protein
MLLGQIDPGIIDMDLDWIIRELLEERKRLDRLIRALEEPDMGRAAGMSVEKSRRGRKSMDGAARREVSERMKQYWAKKREERAAEAPVVHV